MMRRGIYLLVDPDVMPADHWPLALPDVLQTGLALVQLRCKGRDAETRLHLAATLKTLCDANATPLLINDDVALAQRVGAQGVHLGQGDGEIAPARKALGADAIIGRTCHNSIDQIQQAAREGADYASIGAMFPSSTKPSAIPADMNILRNAIAASTIPICAIGGIGAREVPMVTRAGAPLIAVCAAILKAPSPAEAAQHLVRLFADEFQHHAI